VAAPPVDVLRRVPLFSDLEPRELERIAGQFKERQFDAGQTVATEGAGGAGFFVIDEGEARVSVGGKDRARLGPGDYFGEIALIDEGARSATITAETPLRCYGMTFWDFRPLVQENASIAWKLLQATARMLRAAERRGFSD
jgi:CRP/FNR family cyclic AMP-dependent transcriptional regulator